MSLPSVPSEIKCSICGRLRAPDQTTRYSSETICADCKIPFLEKIREGGIHQPSVELPTFTSRFLAKAVDVFAYLSLQTMADRTIFYPIFRSIPAVPENYGLILKITGVLHGILLLSYNIAFLYWRGQTVGKMVLGIKVERRGGGRLSLLQAVVRVLAELLSCGLFLLGYLLAVFDSERRALHDSLARTKVVKVPRDPQKNGGVSSP